MILFAGTYTKNTSSEGIYTLEFNESNNDLSVIHTMKAENPSFLITEGTNLYSVNELQNEGGYTKFLINSDYSLKEEQRLTMEGSSSCHIAKREDLVFVANYGSGNFGCFKKDNDSGLENLAIDISFSGSGPNKRRQSQPHTHSVNVSPNGKHLVVADLGIDCLVVYDITGGIEPIEINRVENVGAGEGPRHLCFHPTLNKLYVVTELLNNVISFDYNPITGELIKKDSYPVNPSSFSGESTSAHICLSRDNRFLYASNRGWNGLAAFNVDESGDISPMGFFEGFGKVPRSFAISKDNEYIIIAYQDSDLVVIAKRDIKTGEVKDVVSSINIPSPVCIIPY